MFAMAMGQNAEVETYVVPRSIRVSVVGIFAILSIGSLYYARSFFLPLVLAILVTLVMAPLVRALANRGLPTGVAASILVLLLAAILVGLSLTLSDPLTRALGDAPTMIRELRDRFAFLQAPFSTLSDASREVEQLAGGGRSSDSPQQVVMMQPGLLTWLAGTAAGIGTTLGATLILSLFLLASRDKLRLKLVRAAPELSDKKRSLRVLRDIENEVSRYLLTITAINAGVGLCVGLAMMVLGMPNALLWGIAAALLNYIPFIGPLVGECLALGVASITYPTLFHALLPPLAYFAIQMIEGNLVTPTVVGRRLELSPVAILVFLALSTWMWGVIGAVIGVPVLVVIKVFCDNFPTLAALGEFLSTEPDLPENETVTSEPQPSPAGAVVPLTRESI
jgi:predicted PurR-regulated permease PerM